jgi:hypothetical protein
MGNLLNLLIQAIPEALGGLTVVLLLFLGKKALGSRARSRAPAKSERVTDTSEALQDPGLPLRFRLRRNQVRAIVHKSYQPPLDPEVLAAFQQINAIRRDEGLKEHFALTRYRVIQPPRLHAGLLEMDLAPINFAHFAILTDSRSLAPARRHVRGLLEDVAAGVAERLRSEDALFNAQNYVPLGVEIVLITRDGKTLLRQRGSSVLTAPRNWDVSVSGYCGEVDLVGSEIDFGMTVENETRRELGLPVGDPREIRFTGLYSNGQSGAMDMLGYWRLEMTSKELVDLVSGNSPGRAHTSSYRPYHRSTLASRVTS